MRVGALYAILRLEKNQFETALMTSGSKFGAFMGVLKAGALVATQAFALVTGGALYMAQSFEKHMNESLAIMGNVAPKLREEMETAAREVAKTTTFSATQAADAYYYLASAGYTAQQMIKALPTVARFAQAGVMDLETATSLLMDTQTTMGLRTEDATQNMENMTRVSDVLTAAQVHSNATLQQMAEAFTNKAGPALRLLNKDIEEGAAVLAVMANQGVKGRVAGTNLAIVLRELQTKAIKNKDAFKELGVAVYDASGNMRNIADIIEDLEDATTGLSDEQKKQVLLDLGFTDRSVGFIQALLGRSGAIREYEKLLREAGGTTEEVADKQLDTFNAQLKIAWHRVQDVAISIGQYLLPKAKDIVKAFNDWILVNDDLIVSIAIGIYDAIGDVIGRIGDMIGVVKTLASDLGDLFSHDDRLFGDDFFGGWGWLEENLPGIAKAIEDTAYWIGEVARNLGELEKFAGDDSPLGVIGSLVVALNDAFTTLVNDTLPAVKEAIEPLVDEVLAGLGEKTRWLFEDIFPQLVTLWEHITNDAAPKLGDALNYLKDEVFPKLGDAVKWFVDEPMTYLQDMLTHLLEWINEHFPEMQATVEAALELMGEYFQLFAEIVGTTVAAIWFVLEPVADELFPIIGTAAEDMLVVLQFVFSAMKIGIQAVRFVFETEIGLIKTAIDGIIWMANRLIDAMNGVIAAANWLSGTNTPMIPHIGESAPKRPPGDAPLGTPKTSTSTSGGRTPPPNMLAAGTMGFPGGWTWVGEKGPELLKLPTGSQILSSQLSRMQQRGGTGPDGDRGIVNVNLTVEGDLRADERTLPGTIQRSIYTAGLVGQE